tara:strand:- start:67 stop:468 length:402 start_codon:yes stop_codon:yes gene_type:complete
MDTKAKKILTEISAGELLDKISILEIKLERVQDKEGLKEINKEYKVLKNTQDSNIKITEDLKDLFHELKKINIKLWEIEDQVRACEKNKDFGDKFVQLARNVYLSNDKRSDIKLKINKLLGSNLREIKKYSDY